MNTFGVTLIAFLNSVAFNVAFGLPIVYHTVLLILFFFPFMIQVERVFDSWSEEYIDVAESNG